MTTYDYYVGMGGKNPDLPYLFLFRLGPREARVNFRSSLGSASVKLEACCLMQMAIASAMSPDPLILWLHSGLRKWFLCFF